MENLRLNIYIAKRFLVSGMISCRKRMRSTRNNSHAGSCSRGNGVHSCSRCPRSQWRQSRVQSVERGHKERNKKKDWRHQFLFLFFLAMDEQHEGRLPPSVYSSHWLPLDSQTTLVSLLVLHTVYKTAYLERLSSPLEESKPPHGRRLIHKTDEAIATLQLLHYLQVCNCCATVSIIIPLYTCNRIFLLYWSCPWWIVSRDRHDRYNRFLFMAFALLTLFLRIFRRPMEIERLSLIC